jgi:hypothetical protein
VYLSWFNIFAQHLVDQDPITVTELMD